MNYVTLAVYNYRCLEWNPRNQYPACINSVKWKKLCKTTHYSQKIHFLFKMVFNILGWTANDEACQANHYLKESGRYIKSVDPCSQCMLENHVLKHDATVVWLERGGLWNQLWRDINWIWRVFKLYALFWLFFIGDLA